MGTWYDDWEPETPAIRQQLQQLVPTAVPRGKILLTEGAACTSVPLVLEGRIRVFKSSDTGREITLYRIEPRQICLFSGACAGEGGRFPATALTELDTLAVFVPALTHQYLLRESPAWQRLILGQYNQRLISLVTLVEEITFHKMDQRLAALILDRGQHNRYPATHQEIALQLGTTREVVTRILGDFETQGWIEIQRGGVLVLDADGLLGVERRLG